MRTKTKQPSLRGATATWQSPNAATTSNRAKSKAIYHEGHEGNEGKDQKHLSEDLADDADKKTKPP